MQHSVSCFSSDFSEKSVALVGIACRFPGSANTPELFWDLLKNGIDASAVVPPSRWDADKYFDPTVGAPNKAYTRRGSFIDQVDLFDPQFFGISGREAIFMDPQQRLLLEVSWEAIERSGLSLQSLKKYKTGAYVGCMNYDYAQLVAEAESVDLHANTGTTPSALSGRLAHTLGLTGPVLTLDTACSSSLLCVHLASQSIRQGECDFALVGGVNLQLTPFTTVMECAGRMLSPDGRCKSFSDQADGFGRGDACGVVLLVNYDLAKKQNLPIMAVIQGSAVNHDGAAGAMTVPNGPAQKDLIESALKNAGLSPADISYIEAHGTGTDLGDPIEVNALNQVFGKERSLENPLWIGSVKTNIGHTEAAAGISGLIKAALMLSHRELVPSLHFLGQPSKKIQWEELPIKVSTETKELVKDLINADEQKLYVGVSSFGLSGTNVHIILGSEEKVSQESNQEYNKQMGGRVSEWVAPLCLNSKTLSAMENLVKSYRKKLSKLSDQDYTSFAYTSCVAQNPMKYKIIRSYPSREEAIRGLDLIQACGVISEVSSVPVLEREYGVLLPSEKINFGQEQDGLAIPVFKKVLDEVSALTYPADKAKAHQNINLGASKSLEKFTYSLALGQTCLSLGMKPSIWMGEGVGLVAALVLSKVLSLQEAIEYILNGMLPADLKQVPSIPVLSRSNGFIFYTKERADLNKLLLGNHKTEDLETWETVFEDNDIEDLLIFENLNLNTNSSLISIYSCEFSNGLQALSNGLSKWMNAGHFVDYSILYSQPPERVLRPTYPFDRQSYWVKKDVHSEWQFTKGLDQEINNSRKADKKIEAGDYFTIPGLNTRSGSNEVVFRLKLEADSLNYWANHKIENQWVIPGVLNIQVLMGFLEKFNLKNSFQITKLTFHKTAMVNLNEQKNYSEKIFQAVFSREEQNTWSYRAYVGADEHWDLIASAELEPFVYSDLNLALDINLNIKKIETTWLKTVEASELYKIHNALGYQLGAAFQWLSSGYYSEGETLRIIQMPREDLVDLSFYSLYPGLIDSCLQSYDSNGHDSAMNSEDNKVYVPFHIRKFIFGANFDLTKPAWTFAKMLNKKEDYSDSSTGDIYLFQEAGLVLKMEGVEYRKAIFNLNFDSNLDTSALKSDLKIQEEIKRPVEKLNINDLDDPALSNLCLEVISDVMNLPKDQIDNETPFISMGLDSIMALEISSEFKEKLGLEVPLVMLLESASINRLMNLLREEASRAESDPVDQGQFIEIEL